jgi:hypothetical protein
MDASPPIGSSVISPEIEQIRLELGQLKKRLPDRVTRIGAILGIVAALVGGAKGGFDFYKWLTRAPKIAMVAGPSLSMEYEPLKNRIKFDFAFSVANYGDEPNVVDGMDAHLSSSSIPSENTVQFSSLDFTCFSGGGRVPIPFPLTPGLPVTVSCTAESDVPAQTLELLTQTENRFEVELYGRKNSKDRMPFCFFLPADVTHEATASPHSAFRRRFVNPQCS